jgi:hypothetical protein
MFKKTRKSCLPFVKQKYSSSIAIPTLIVAMALPFMSFADEILVLANESGTSSTGTWGSASAASMPYQGNRGRYATSGGSIETYTFTPTLPELNSYQVEVYNSCYSPRSNQVIHRINHANGTKTEVVDQDCQTDPFVGEWRNLGTYTFNPGTEGSVVIDTTNSNNSYVGATAVRFVYQPNTSGPVNLYPSLTPSDLSIEVDEGEIYIFTATAIDPEDGDISADINWSGLSQNSIGTNFSLTAVDTSFIVNLEVTDSGGALTTSNIAVNVTPTENPTPEPTPGTVNYDFECLNLEPLVGFTTNNPTDLPNVGMRCGKYVAELTDNAGEKTLHFNNAQGRLDAVLVNLPFEAVARNIGPAKMGDVNSKQNVDGIAYIFAGLQVHHADLENRNSAHLVVGQRGYLQDTIEGKMTRDGRSGVNDIGAGNLPDGRADIRIVGDAQGILTAYWQTPNKTGDTFNDAWILYNSTGRLPGQQPVWDGDSVYVGLITYAAGNGGVPFMGVSDGLEITQ